MCAKKINLLKSIARSHLCSRCGTCVGLGNGKVIFDDREHSYRPRFVGELSEQEAARIYAACPGKGFNFPDNRRWFYERDHVEYNHYLGPYNGVFIGHSDDPLIRRTGASGGLISAVLIYLLETKQIDGAVVLGMSKEKPWLSEPFIATTREDILVAAQSKYTISSVNEILAKVEKFSGILAFVGIPPQVHSIRLLQRMNDPAVRNIKYIFGPYYGNALHFTSVISFLKTFHERDYRQINKLYFRYGEWPGSMRVEMKNGRVIELKKFHANYLIPFHIMRNSLYCIDLANEFTDISGGDAWAPVYEERGKGFSMIISRSAEGKRILDEMRDRGLLNLLPITADESVKMHSHGYDLKKRGAFIRMSFRRMHGGAIPDWGCEYPKITIKRYIMEIIVSSLFLLMGTRIARFTIELFPPSFVGKIFEKARTCWKNSTHDIKRELL